MYGNGQAATFSRIRASWWIRTRSIPRRGSGRVRSCAAAPGRPVPVFFAIRGATSMAQIGGTCGRDFAPARLRNEHLHYHARAGTLPEGEPGDGAPVGRHLAGT